MTAPEENLQLLGQALLQLRQSVRLCDRCFFLASDVLCSVCSNPRRDRAQICVVGEALDVLAVERSGEFSGVYHVLGGGISPIDGIGPNQLHIAELERRIADDAVREVVIATNPDVEGEATAHYLSERLARLQISVTRLAHGLPAGADLQYADEVTVARALAGRRAF